MIINLLTFDDANENSGFSIEIPINIWAYSISI